MTYSEERSTIVIPEVQLNLRAAEVLILEMIDDRWDADLLAGRRLH